MTDKQIIEQLVAVLKKVERVVGIDPPNALTWMRVMEILGPALTAARAHLEQPTEAHAAMDAQEEIDALRQALAYVAHASHVTPLHMLPNGVMLCDGDGVVVRVPNGPEVWGGNASEYEKHRLAALAAARAHPEQPTEDFCYCDKNVSLQMVSDDGAPEGYLGRVTLRIGDQYRDYYTHPQASEPAPSTEGERMEILSGMAREQLNGQTLVYDTESGRMKSVPKPAGEREEVDFSSESMNPLEGFDSIWTEYASTHGRFPDAYMRKTVNQTKGRLLVWFSFHHDAIRAALLQSTAQPAERKYISPVHTVADLINNLMLMDQTLPIYGAQWIDHAGKRRCIAVSPTVSRECIKDSRWIGEGTELNAAVIWTRAEQPAKPAQEPLTSERAAAESEYSTTAHNYPEAQIGSRDWVLYWAGWLARSTYKFGITHGHLEVSK